MVLVAIAGLVFVIGCGNSVQKQKMTDFVKEFEKAVGEYANADAAHKTEGAMKVEDLMAKWTQMKMELGSELTPQVLDELDLEYNKFAKQFKALSGKA